MLPDNYKQDIQVLKRNIQSLGERVNEAERQCADIFSCVQEHHLAIQYLLLRDEEHASHLEDIENWNYHKNIRDIGIPKSVLHKDLDSTLQRIFPAILNSSENSPIELDRAPRFSVRALIPLMVDQEM